MNFSIIGGDARIVVVLSNSILTGVISATKKSILPRKNKHDGITGRYMSLAFPHRENFLAKEEC